MDIYIYIILTFETILSILLIYSTKSFKNTKDVFFSALIIFFAFIIRFSLLSHQTLDYQDFLSKWVAYFKENGGFKAISSPIGNYNIPYLYILAAISYSHLGDLYLIKLTSILFDIFLAYGCALIAKELCHNRKKIILTYLLTLILPTVILNSSYWGQCDSIYTSLGIFGIYFAMKNRPRLSIIFFALSFSFKLQAIFILPVILIFIIDKKIKPLQLVWFPITYILTLLPALFLGLPFADGISLYFNQTGSVGTALNYNSSSIFSIVTISTGEEHAASLIAIISAFALMVFIFIIHYLFKKTSTKKAEFSCACLFAIMIPFALPHMHDRYFFVADILSLTLSCITPELFIIPILVEFGSFLGYYAYLQGAFFLPMKYGGTVMLFALILSFIYYLISLKPRKI